MGLSSIFKREKDYAAEFKKAHEKQDYKKFIAVTEEWVTKDLDDANCQCAVIYVKLLTDKSSTNDLDSLVKVYENVDNFPAKNEGLRDWFKLQAKAALISEGAQIGL